MAKNFIVSLVLLAAVDFLWLGLIANRFYLNQFGDLARVSGGRFDIVYWAAIGVYVLLAAGLCAFALPLAQSRLGAAFAYGALFGLIVYGVYDLTNHATLRHWPLALLAADMAWGTFACGFVTALTVWIRKIWE